MASIAEFMSRDHDRLDSVFSEFQRDPEGEKAQELFTQFESGLRAHIDWEEEILFPPFEEKTGMRDSGPTAVMRMEHRQIKQLLETIRGRIGNSGVAEPAKGLVEVLTAHNQKEESILYPWLDQSLQETERDALLGRIKETAPGAGGD